MRVLVTVALLVVLGAGCAGPAQRTTSEADLPDAAPRPTGDVVLTVAGSGSDTDWDLAGLRQLPTEEISVLEPFIEQRTSFTVVALADVLTMSGVGPGTTVRLTALDDYTIELHTEQIEQAPALLAVAENGDGIPVEAGGPVRVVFPDGSALGRNSDQWIWSVRTIEERA